MPVPSKPWSAPGVPEWKPTPPLEAKPPPSGPFTVFALRDPDDREIHYIGATGGDPLICWNHPRRLGKHPARAWLERLTSPPLVEVLAVVTGYDVARSLSHLKQRELAPHLEAEWHRRGTKSHVGGLFRSRLVRPGVDPPPRRPRTPAMDLSTRGRKGMCRRWHGDECMCWSKVDERSTATV